MNKLTIVSMSCVASLLVSPMAMADVKVRAGAASGSYSIDYKVKSTSVTTSVNAKYVPINLGASYVADNGFYVDLGYTGGTGTHDLYTTSESFKRSDVALIAGKANVRESGFATTFYGGIKSGQTVLGSATAFENKFTASGLVGGFGMNFPVGPGSLGVNAGLGLMGASWAQTGSTTDTADAAVGFSFGLGYTLPITGSMGVVIDYKGNAYSYVFNSGLSNEYSIVEKTGAVGANFYAVF